MSSHDDWAPTSLGGSQNKPIKFPSFPRLFLIHRVLSEVKHTSNNAIEYKSLISESTMDKQLLDTAQKILSRLMKHGLKKYMKKYYNEEKQSHTIEIIFNQIILKTFEKEYNNVTTYTNKNLGEEKNNTTNFQTTLFNTTDIMCLILQFLVDFELDRFNKHIGNLSNCSLVCSQWFYHSFNPQSIYGYNLFKLMIATAKCQENGDENNVTRMWQRLRNVKNIRMEVDGDVRHNVNYNNSLLLNKISLYLRNVEVIINDAHGGSNRTVPALQMVLRNCKEKIVKYEIDLSIRGQHKLSPLVLNNAVEISTDHAYFSIFWSNKCEKLTFSRVHGGIQWCNDIIDNCDCSGVKEIRIGRLGFEYGVMDVKQDSTKVLMKKLGKALTRGGNLKILAITFWRDVDPCVLLLCKHLQPIVERNNGYFEMSIPGDANAINACDNVLTTIEQLKPQIQKLRVAMGTEWWDIETRVQKIINNTFESGDGDDHDSNIDSKKKFQALEWLYMDATSYNMESYIEILKELNVEFNNKSGIFELYDWNIFFRKERFDDMIKILNWISEIKQELALIIHIRMSELVQSRVEIFDKFCNIVYMLLIEKKMAVDINVSFDYTAMDNKCQQIFESYFGEKMIKEYAAPRCRINVNKYMTARAIPITSFKVNKDEYFRRVGLLFYEFRVANIDRRLPPLWD